MTAIPITGLYTGLTIILAIILGAGIGLHRGKTKVSIGDGGDPETLRETIVNARFGVMPAWGERLGPAEVNAVAAYVHGLGGGE